IAAAGLGGADSITALPHTAALGLPDAFARRIVRNTQLILLEESNLAKVGDPAAGSGAIEDLTSKLCASAWKLFQEIESTGRGSRSRSCGPPQWAGRRLTAGESKRTWQPCGPRARSRSRFGRTHLLVPAAIQISPTHHQRPSMFPK